jgi:ArsR family transcriptional regulator
MKTTSRHKPSLEEEITELQARICQALSHPKRLQIVYSLREGEQCVGDLVKALDLPYANLSQHLRVLHEAGLLDVRQEGKFSYYRLATPQIAQACELVRAALRERLEKMAQLAHFNGIKKRSAGRTL